MFENVGNIGVFASGILGSVCICTIAFLMIVRKLNEIIKAKDAEFNKVVKEKDYRIVDLLGKVDKLTQENANVVSHRKSSEVRLGKIAENMAPFFDSWPYDPNTFRFIGDPVDGIQFTDDAVIFVEIKSGNAKLSKRQRSIKELIKLGKVRFATFRVSEQGSDYHIVES